MEAINWPKEFTPGFTDNFVSAETYVAGLTAEEVFPYLTHAYIWHEYYDGASDVKLRGSDEKPELKDGTKFSFNIIGWDVTAEVVEFVEPSKDRPGRLSWHGWVPGVRIHDLMPCMVFFLRICPTGGFVSSLRSLKSENLPQNLPKPIQPLYW